MKIIKTYNLVNTKGNRLQLMLGALDSSAGLCTQEDTGFRWSFLGTNIPMPVRNGTWFNGFPENIMLAWLEEHGWYVETCVNCTTYRVTVYDHSQKGNECFSQNENEPDDLLKSALNHAMQLLIEAKCPLRAERLYKRIYGCSPLEAAKAVRDMYRLLTADTKHTII